MSTQPVARRGRDGSGAESYTLSKHCGAPEKPDSAVAAMYVCVKIARERNHTHVLTGSAPLGHVGEKVAWGDKGWVRKKHKLRRLEMG